MKRTGGRADWVAGAMAVVAVVGLATMYFGGAAEAVDESMSVTATISSMLSIDYVPTSAGVDDPAYITTSPSGGVGTGSATLTAKSNNPTGYVVKAKMYSDDANLNYLVSEDYTEYSNGGATLVTTANVFAPTAQGAVTLANNTWGYYVGTPGTITWSAVPVATGTAATLFSSSTYGEVSSRITFGAKQGFVGLDADGTYANTVLFSIVNNVP